MALSSDSSNCPERLFIVFQSIMRGIGRPNLPVYIALGTVLLNFLLDPLFIFGWGPVPAFGVMGAAMTTFASQAIAAGIGMTVLRLGLHGIHVQRRYREQGWHPLASVRKAWGLTSDRPQPTLSLRARLQAMTKREDGHP